MQHTYRAAIWTSADRQAQLRLTDESQQHLSDEALLKAAEIEAASVNLWREDGDSIIVDMWSE